MFTTGNFGSLDPWTNTLASIQVLKVSFTIIVTVMLLNSLIALLNLRVKDVEKRVSSFGIRIDSRVDKSGCDKRQPC